MRTGTTSVKTWVPLVILVVLALVLFAVPARFEGPVLVPISPGHGLSLVDVAAVVPLLGAVGMVAAALVRNRDRLSRAIRGRPGAATAVVFTGGAGLGLLLASVFAFFWWWAVGAVLFSGALGLTVRAAVVRRDAPAELGNRWP
jgi:hypothetical protein